MIPEFRFDHAIYPLVPDNYMHDPSTQFTEIFMRCTAFLNLQNRPDSGLTVLVSPKWMCVIPFTQPYCTAPNGNPVYLDGFDFAGLMTL